LKAEPPLVAAGLADTVTDGPPAAAGGAPVRSVACVPSDARTAVMSVVIAGPVGVGTVVVVVVVVIGVGDELDEPQRRVTSDAAITPLNRANAGTVTILNLLRSSIPIAAVLSRRECSIM
jgi:hypothetical protein